MLAEGHGHFDFATLRYASLSDLGWVWCFGFSLILGYNLVKGSSPSIRAPGPFLREIGGLVISTSVQM